MTRDGATDAPLLYADDVFRIQGAIFEVNREMGAGFLEHDAIRRNRLIVESCSRIKHLSAFRPLNRIPL